MIHVEKKLAKIVEELTLFFFSLEGTEISSTITKKGSIVYITFESDFNPAYTDEIVNMENLLTGHHDDALEDVYWELAGSGDPGEENQLLLIGMMIDSVKIQNLGKKVLIHIEKRL